MPEDVLFHGSTVVVDSPICAFGRDNLDFGKGFYLTPHRLQAENWARRLTVDMLAQPVLNIYHFDRSEFLKHGRGKIFSNYDKEWLDFVVASRTGGKPWTDYDMIDGGMVNDRVFDIVNLYMTGLIDADIALGRLSLHQPNNQVCLLNQALLDKYLKYIGYEIVEGPE